MLLVAVDMTPATAATSAATRPLRRPAAEPAQGPTGQAGQEEQEATRPAISTHYKADTNESSQLSLLSSFQTCYP